METNEKKINEPAPQEKLPVSDPIAKKDDKKGLDIDENNREEYDNGQPGEQRSAQG